MRLNAAITIAVLLVGCRQAATIDDLPPAAEQTMEPSYAEVLEDVAQEIATLADHYPQLADFDVETHLDRDRLVISYGYNTTRGQGAGWAGATPKPLPDGVWFYIDFHDPDSMAQIHTQPVVMPQHFRDKRVMFLIREGSTTNPVGGELQNILTNQGVERGDVGE